MTTDQNLRYQQNLQIRRIAILVLMSTSWPKIQTQLSKIVTAVDAIKPSHYVEVDL